MGLKDTASLALIPAAYKTSKIYSALPTDGDGDFTFTRIGNATRINKAGLVETMGTNIGRLNYDLTNGTPASCPSLLLEPSRQNYTAYSEQFNNSYWTKATSDSTPNPTVTANAAIAPDGTQTADKVDLTAPSNNNWAVVKRDGINTGATVGSKLQQSLYLKAYDSSQVGKKVDIYMYDFSNTVYKTVYNYTLTADWERVVVEHTITGANTSTNIQFAFGKARSSVGGSSQAETATDFLVWGAQLEKASYPSSYIPTSGSAVTRTVDKCFNGGDVNLFNLTEGTFFIDVNPFIPSANTNIGISNGTDAQKIVFIFQTNGTQVRTFSSGGVSEYDNLTFNQRNKIAVSFKTNEYKIFINGTKVGTDTSASVPTGMNRLNFSNRSNSSSYFEGEIYQTMVFNEALSDSELQTLTS